MTYKVKNIQYRIQLDTDKNIFIVFDAIAHLKQLN